MQEAWFFYAASHIQAGQAALSAGTCERALTSFQEAARLDPLNLAAWGGIGEALSRLGNDPEARKAFARLVDIVGGKAGDLGGLGATLLGHGWHHAACALWEAAEIADPGDASWPANQAAALKALGHSALAGDKAWRAFRMDPDLDAAKRVLGELAEEADDLAGAIRFFAAIAKPDAQVLAHLAQNYLLMGDGEGAARDYGRAAKQDAAFASAALMSLHYCPGLSMQEVVARHLEWGAQFPAPVRPAWKGVPGQPLRLGFVSPDFRNHATGVFLPPLLKERARCGWQAILYSNTRSEDDTTQRFKSLCEGWRDIRGLSDAEAADLVRADGIDILIDLNGHTAGNRLGLFALRPAPVQMAYLDYVCTTGLAQIDYRLHDRIHLLQAEAALYSEQALWMDGDIFLYEPPAYAPDVSPAPCQKNGFVTFGSFNALFKTGEPCIALWCDVLRAVPEARFLIASPNLKYAAAQERLKGLFRKYGVDPARLTLLGEADHATHLSRFGLVDMVLDSQPYSGGLTTLEALWMGVPVLTLEGDRLAGRHSTCHLKAVGCDELVAPDADSYVLRAIDLGRNPEPLVSWRKRLRARVSGSVLCDAGRYSDNFTSILDKINVSPYV
ncbi:MAG: tetratricopeptide repeat protein [Rhodospirillales bacterium]|nr:tetratricopeptide repeat protein [Rhodospirillales bacterium]